MGRNMARKSILGAMAGLGLGLAMTGNAAAQVLEIGDDGTVVTHSGPAVYSSEGVQAIAPQRPAAPMRATPEEVRLAIAEASARHTVPISLVEAVAWQESRFNQGAVSPKGALGVMQLLPSTASSLGVNPTDLRANIDGGVASLAQQMRRFGDVSLALAAYNAGPGAVERYRGIPPYAETRNYVRAIMSRLGSAAE